MLRIAIVLLAISVALPAHAQPAQPPAAAPAKPAARKSAPPKGLPASPQAGGPCIGVISTIGEGFGVKKIGFTVFGNEYKEIPANDFKLDDLVVERVQAAVGRGLVARRIAHAKGAFGSYPRPGGWATRNAAAEALVQQAAGSTRCERYVVLTRSTATFSGNQDIVGVGIVNTGASLVSRSHIHALVNIGVHDRTFAIIKNGGAFAPTRQLDDFKWPESPEAVNTPAVRAAARALLAEALDKRLPSLFAP